MISELSNGSISCSSQLYLCMYVARSMEAQTTIRVMRGNSRTELISRQLNVIAILLVNRDK